MAILGVIQDRRNPPENGKRAFTLQDFLYWMPSFKNVNGKEKSYSSVFEKDAEYFMGDTDTVATPVLCGLYEKNDNDEIILSSDTIFIPSKTYYKDSGGLVEANPYNCGLFEPSLQVMFNALYPIANGKIYYAIFGKDWYYAMALCIAHYNYLRQIQATSPTGKNITDVTGGGVTRGVMTSAQIGGFSKTYDLNYTALSTEEALFWNQSAYGMSLLALFKSKSTLTMFVVTNGPLIPGSQPFNKFGDGPNESGQDYVDRMINPRKFRP